jgi:hypothetical protein
MSLLIKLILLMCGITLVMFTLLNPTFWEELRNAWFRDHSHNNDEGQNI